MALPGISKDSACGNNSSRLEYPAMPTLYSTKQAAELLEVTERRVRQLIMSGQLQALKLGRDHVIPEEALEQARQRKTKRGPEPGALLRKEAA
jgi:excisionase family DNA binding protein